jgi:SAM-dependent methyltransferase
MNKDNSVNTSKCKICSANTHLLEDSQIKVTYSVCDECGFIYKNLEHHPNIEAEQKEYMNHNNSFESLGYVKMFENFINDFIEPLNITGKVLEFGSGPGPVLKELLLRKGYNVFDFDPFFNPNKEYLDNKYDLITSTEVIEHFSQPLEEFAHLNALLNPNGYLVIMTGLNVLSEEKFLKWWYRRELTHISFYSIKTLEFIAKTTGYKLVNHNSKNVVVFQKTTK